MFVGVILTAVLIHPDWGQVAAGLFVPRIPRGGTAYTLGVLGGVGGTVTLMSYGYWIRERGRSGARGACDCRIDLGAGYAMTALFGLAMILIGSRVTLRQGPTAALELAGQLALVLGPIGKWIFLAGFWGAVFSSLLGVWQSIPYLFADFYYLHRRADRRVAVPAALAGTRPYRAYLVAIALVPLPLLWMSLERAQLSYAVLGACFMPLLALTLLLLNNRTAWVGAGLRNRWLTTRYSPRRWSISPSRPPAPSPRAADLSAPHRDARPSAGAAGTYLWVRRRLDPLCPLSRGPR